MINLDEFMPSAITKRHDRIRARMMVKKCEKEFNRTINEAIEKVFEGEEEVKVITLAGPTCSGKTTTATKLTDRIDRSGKNAVMLSIDDFFLGGEDRNNINKEAPDYDSVNAIDLDYLRVFIRDLLDGKTVYIPQYSFVNQKRSGYEEFIPDPSDIYIFEGIQAVYPEITSLLPEGYRSIFICPRDDVSYNGVILKNHELRFLRRIVRDYKFRDASPEYTFHLWTNVRKNEEENIFPNEKSDIYINSFLMYEPFVISQFALRLLRAVPEGSPYKDEADELYSRVMAYDERFFSAKMIPHNSVFREFIGYDDE